MNPSSEWEQLNQSADDDLVRLLQQPRFTTPTNADPVARIRKNLIIHAIWAIVISIIYVVVIGLVDVVVVRACMALILTFNIWAIWGSFKLYKQLSQSQPVQSVLAKMEQQYSLLASWKKLYLKTSLLLYPVSAVGGFLLGLHVGAAQPIEVVLQKKMVWISLIVTVVAITPAAHWLGKKLTEIAFGKHIQHLKENIDAWKHPE
jgi:hypothetical protein